MSGGKTRHLIRNKVSYLQSVQTETNTSDQSQKWVWSFFMEQPNTPQPKDPLEEFSETPLDIFHFYMGLLRNSIKEVSPETWWGLLGKTPPN